MTEQSGLFIKELKKRMSNQNKLRKLENKRIELVRKLQLCEHYKEKTIKFVQELNNQYNKGLISYKEYYYKLNRALDQRTLKQWIEYYDGSVDYYRYKLNICEKEIKKQENIARIAPAIMIVAVFMILGFGFLFLKPTITGLIVGIGEEAYTQDIGLVVNESSVDEWQLEQIGVLRSVRVSGKILGNGSVKIYLDDKLVLDSSKLEKSGISMITGLAISDLTETNEGAVLSENITNIIEETENITAPEILGTESITNITVPEENITIAEEIEANITIPEEAVNISENITIPEENITEPIVENITKLVEIKEKLFKDVCIETCSLDLNKTSYELRFEIENAVLYLDSISYTIKPIEIPEVPKAVENVSKVEETVQGQAEINKPVKWTKNIVLDETVSNLTVKLPENISNVKVSKIKDKIKEEISLDKLKIREAKQPKPIKEHVEKKIEGPEEETELVIEDDVREIEIEYYTKAPEVMEKEINAYKKQITVYSDVHYENILAYTSIRESRKELIKLYWLVNDSRELINDVSYIDTNNNGLIDRLEWIVPSLSDQTYEVIIEISKAEHLDENRSFISDIYDDVYQLDNIWSEPIYNKEYVRVTFEKELTSNRDITIYARNNQILNTIVEVYYYNSTEKITEFPIISEEKYYKIYLTGMSGSHDTFDLKIKNLDDDSNAYLEFDHIIDPVEGLTPLLHVNTEKNSVDLLTAEVTAITTDDTGFVTVTKNDVLTVEFSELSQGIDTLIDANCSLTYYTDSGYGNTGTFYVYDAFNAGLLDSTTITVSTSDNVLNLVDLETKGLDKTEVTSILVKIDNPIPTKPYAIYVDKLVCTIDYTPVTVETTAPNITLISPANNTWQTTRNINFTFNATTNDDFDSCALWTNETIWGLKESNKTAIVDASLSWINDTFPAEGHYLWNIECNDTIGNANFSSANRTFTVDTTNPSVTISYPTINEFIKGTILWVNGTASDTNNVTNVDIIINDSKWGTTKSGTYADWYFQNTSAISDGTYTILITANDSAGNLNNTEIISFTVDNTLPILTITTSNNTVSNTLTTIEGTASDINNNTIYANNTAWTWNGTYTSWKFTNNTNIADGLYHILITANDSAGNTNSSLFAFTYDTTPPTYSNIHQSVTNNTNVSVGQSITFGAQWNDETGLSMYVNSTSINSSGFTNGTWQSFTAGNWSNFTISYPSIAEGGNFTVKIFANDTTNNMNETGIWYWKNVTAPENTAPVVNYVSLITPQSISAGTVAYISFTFNATDADGAVNLDNSKAKASFNLTGETTRTNTSCSYLAESGNTRQYNCTIGIWYWDGAGDWTINASIEDINDAHAENSSTTFTLQETTAMVMSPTSLGWPSVNLTNTNVLSNTDPIIINNTANKNITNGNVNVTAISLKGAEITSEFIYAENFSVNTADACGGTDMVNNTATGISGATIDKGNNSAGDGQEELYFCLKGMLQTISAQTYSATAGDAWTIAVE